MTLKKETLAALPVGECAIRLTYASGAVETIRIQVTDSSQNSLDKTAVTYDKYAGGGIALHLTAPAGATIQAVEWDGQALQPGGIMWRPTAASPCSMPFSGSAPWARRS